MNPWQTFLCGVTLVIMAPALCRAEAPPKDAPSPGLPFVYENWEVFTTKNTDGGLPNDHIFFVRADGDRVWIGTENGLACYQDGKFKHWGKDDGLPWHVVAAIDVSPLTGDVWLGLFGGGLCRFSGGRFDHFHQLNSGLVNDVVYGVAVQDQMIWVATTAGVSSYDTITGEWSIYTEKNAPMEEIWCYSICYADGKVYVAVWGGGVLEWDVKLKRWKAYIDPDGEMEIDLYRDDGLVHIITTAVSYESGLLWASTYFGLSRYDGRHWRGYMEHESGLVSDFINFNKARDKECWVCTDEGLSVLVDFPTDTWVTYKKNEGAAGAGGTGVPPVKGHGQDAHATSENGVAVIQRGMDIIKTVPTKGSIPNKFVMCVDFQGDDVWVGTSKGLARGIGKGRWAGLEQSDPLAPKELAPAQASARKKP